MMTIKPIPELPKDHGIRFAKSISRLSLADLIKNLQVQELSGEGDSRTRFFNITVDFWPAQEYEEEHVISTANVDKTLKNKFIARLEKLIGMEMKKKAKEASLSETTAAVPQIGATAGREKSPPRERAESADHEGGEDDEDDGEDDEDIDPDDAKQTATRDRQEKVYDEPDDDEKAADAESSEDEPAGDSDPESTSSQQAPRKKRPDKAAQTLREQDPDDADSDEEDSSNESDSGLLAEHVHLKRFKFDPRKSHCRIQLSYDISTPKIVLLPIVEKAARLSVIQQIPGIGACILNTEKVHDRRTGVVQLDPDTGNELTENIITTAGVNLLALRDYQDIIDPHTIATNSIHAMAELYGIEAARATIVREIDGVFKSHGISVDLRHLLLIGDAMTQSGTYKGFNRNGVVRDTGSVLAKMSFETVMGVLKDAVLFGEADNLMGPSARIVAGMRGKVGTGSFDVVVPLGGQAS
jgi:DNA-directed RNA polymerase I subunit RPA1